MSKIKTFPKTISVRIERDKDSDYLLADPDGHGLSLVQEGEEVRVGIYKLDHVRIVTMTATSVPAKR